MLLVEAEVEAAHIYISDEGAEGGSRYAHPEICFLTTDFSFSSTKSFSPFGFIAPPPSF